MMTEEEEFMSRRPRLYTLTIGPSIAIHGVTGESNDYFTPINECVRLQRVGDFG